MIAAGYVDSMAAWTFESLVAPVEELDSLRGLVRVESL